MINESISKLYQKQKYQYFGVLIEYQKYGAFEYKKLNPKQHFLFKRVLHGLKIYKPDEITKLNYSKKKRIIKVWKKGQETINYWKQELCDNLAKDFFKLFGDDGKYFVSVEFEYLENYKNEITFKDLGIDYNILILKFMKEGLLPPNFFKIK